LRSKNWIQICLMGDCAKEKLLALLNTLNRVCFRRKGSKNLEGATDVKSNTVKPSSAIPL
jgi:hypothetical protein